MGRSIFLALVLTTSGYALVQTYRQVQQHGLWETLIGAAVPLLAYLATGVLVGRWRIQYRRRFYEPKSADETFYRRDVPNEAWLVLRDRLLFLFRGVRPDVIKRAQLHSARLQVVEGALLPRVEQPKSCFRTTTSAFCPRPWSGYQSRPNSKAMIAATSMP